VETPANFEQPQNSSEKPVAESSTEIEEFPVQSKEIALNDDNQADTIVVEPTPRPEMVATDPSTVVLSSGDIQLVEFFAFW